MAGDITRFAVLGLGAGAIYALMALGIVLIHRGSGVVNFAHGAIGMIGAYEFYDLRSNGTPASMCWVAAVGLGVAIGLLIEFGVMRPLRRAPALARLIATLGIFSILVAIGVARYGNGSTVVTKLLPVDRVDFGGGVVVGRDRLLLLGIAIVLTAGLGLIYRFTRFGLATAAVAENRRALAAQGRSPDVVAGANWAVGSVLAIVAAILVVNITGLTVNGLALLVVPALAAALVGNLRSFPLALLGGLLIGVLQSEVDWLKLYLTERAGHVVSLDGWSQSVPFLLIIVVLVIRGRSLPTRGEHAERPSDLGDGLVRASWVMPAFGLVALAAALLLSDDMLGALITTATIAIVALSLVVVTGYTGQLSLAQFALAGMGGWVFAVLVSHSHWSFPTAALAGVAAAVPIGVLVGLPSLRTRGVNLAIATLGLALVIEAQVLGNAHRTGGLEGLRLGSPSLFGMDVDATRHPQRYALLTVVCFTVLAVVVANLRRSRTGRALIGVRTNERAAAALGISVMGSKVYAFALSAGIAAVGGVLIVARNPVGVFLPTFSVFQSIFVVVYAVIGGVGYLLGAVVAGASSPGGVIITAVNNATGLLDSGAAVQIILGLGLLATLLVHPSGVASTVPRWLRDLYRRHSHGDADRLAPPDRTAVTRASLHLHGVTVTYGGVRAVDDVSLEIRPGQILGLIGPNGAGKTSLVDAVTGFARFDGQLLLDDTPIDGWSPRRIARAGVGRTFQSLELFDTMTVRENLQTASERIAWWTPLVDLIRPGRRPLAGRAVAAATDLELLDVLDQRPENLAYGRRRLVAIARALAAAPSVLLLDEPAAGLDERESAELGALITRVAKDWGVAVLMIEHDVSMVLEVCDRVAVLDQGRLLATGTPDEIRRDSVVVEAYLGVARSPMAARRAERRPAPGEPLVTASAVSAGYGDLAAVRNLDIEVRAGEIVAVLGPNGAGKTTTLLTLVGELIPLAGEIEVIGFAGKRRLHRLVRNGVAYVPTERAVINSLTVRGNLRLGRGSPERALELFPELRPLLARRAGLLSGGEQQMLVLARALAAEPRLIIVDELSLGLAPLIVERLLGALRTAADRGAGVLLVEQHTAEALTVADRAIVLRQGTVELAGTAAELRDDIERLESAYLTGIA